MYKVILINYNLYFKYSVFYNMTSIQILSILTRMHIHKRITYVYTSTYTHTCARMHTHTYTDIYIHTFIHICMYMHVH